MDRHADRLLNVNPAFHKNTDIPCSRAARRLSKLLPIRDCNGMACPVVAFIAKVEVSTLRKLTTAVTANEGPLN